MINALNNYNNSLLNELNKTSKQISSGKKIATATDDSLAFKKYIDLNTDISLYSRLKENITSAKSFAQYTDTALGSMTNTMETFKTKLLAYGGSIHSQTSREALVNELKSLKDSMMQLANTKVNGKYLFSGSDYKNAPIDLSGNYNGNSQKLSLHTDVTQKQEFSIDGASLFLGYDRDIHSRVSTNIAKLDQNALLETPSRQTYITDKSSISDLTGLQNGEATFYMSGTQPNGDSFRHKFTVSDIKNTKVSDLAEEIKIAFNNEVNVELSSNGQFIIEDLKSGNSKLNFHMVGSTANVENISDLGNAKKFEFVKTDTNIDSTTSESMNFQKNGNILINNIQQFISVDSGFATSSTKLSEVANGSLLGKTLNISGKDINGQDFIGSLTFNEDTTSIDLGNGTFELNHGADAFSYKELTEAMGVALSGVTGGSFEEAVLNSEKLVDVKINHRGEFEIKDLTTSMSKMDFAIFDSNVGVYNQESKNGSVLTFNSNKAIDMDRPSVNIFEAIDFAIDAVKQDLQHPDGTRIGLENNRGISGSIDNMSHIIEHIIKERSLSGAQFQNLQYTEDRSDALSTNMKVAQNDIINVDYAETSAYYQALTLNYQAMLASVAKVQGLSLVNYL
jgi:flagellar hook-associated protein 3 FlgL